MINLPEEWRAIPGSKGRYEVSNLGRVRSLTRRVPRGDSWLTIKGQPIRTPLKSSGYAHFKLSDADNSTYPMVHQVVAAAFIGPCPPGLVVNHKNGDKTDNRVENLEYVTPKENIRHALATGLTATGEESHNAKLTAEDVRAIRALRGKVTAKELAKRYGTTHQYIPLIWRRSRWAHLPD